MATKTAKRRVTRHHVLPVPLPTPTGPSKPLEPPAAPPAETWFRSILTDREGYFDLGAILVAFVGVFMCINSGYDTMALGRVFDAEKFGIGVGAMLVGFAGYKYGDAKRPPGYRSGGYSMRRPGEGPFEDKWG